MSIKIKTNKTVNSNGEQMREIVEITGCLGKSDLPAMYRNGDHYAQSISATDIWILKGSNIGGVMQEQTFQKAIEELKLCGQALRDAKKRLSELRAAWNGEETFII